MIRDFGDTFSGEGNSTNQCVVWWKQNGCETALPNKKGGQAERQLEEKEATTTAIKAWNSRVLDGWCPIRRNYALKWQK
jgi:hypothetical protein